MKSMIELRSLMSMACMSGLLVLSACGGGGGSAGTPVLGGGGGTGTGTGTSAPKISLTLSSSTVTAAAPVTAKVTLQDAIGNALAGQVVSFSTTKALGKFNADSALTDENGQATVSVSPATTSAAGADEVVVSALVGTTTVTAKQGFQLTATNIAIASFLSQASTLSAYGQTTLSVQLSGTSPTVPVTVQISSSCVTAGRAVLTPATVTTATGTAVFTFRDGGASGSCGAVQTEDTLTATIAGSTESKAVKVALSKPSAGQITFGGASPTRIYLKNSGKVESATVKFVVRDGSGNPVPQQDVDIEPVSLAGNLTVNGLSDPSKFPITVPSDSNGEVAISINAGSVPTAVSIKATIRGTTISTVSSDLSIGVGLPSQNKFTLALGAQNIEGFNIDGATNTFTVVASDRSGNPVPDGTTVNFWSGESGQVETQKTTLLNSNGLASVTANFASGGARPADGRITVVAYSLGEESFIDLNKDNLYTSGEDFQDLGDVFLDRLNNGSFNPSKDESRSQQDGKGSLACINSTDELLVLGSATPSVPNTCDRTWGKAYVRSAQEMVLSTSLANPMWGTSMPAGSYGNKSCPAPVSRAIGYNADDSAANINLYPIGDVTIFKADGQGKVVMYASDMNSVAWNPMAKGSVVTAIGSPGVTAAVDYGSPIGSTTSAANTLVVVSFKLDDKTTSGDVTVKFTSPSGSTTAVQFSVAKAAKPSDDIPAGSPADYKPPFPTVNYSTSSCRL